MLPCSAKKSQMRIYDCLSELIAERPFCPNEQHSVKLNELYLDTILYRIKQASNIYSDFEYQHAIIILEEIILAITKELDPQNEIVTEIEKTWVLGEPVYGRDAITLTILHKCHFVRPFIVMIDDKKSSEELFERLIGLFGYESRINEFHHFSLKICGLVIDGKNWYLATYDATKNFERVEDIIEIKLLCTPIIPNQKLSRERCLDFLSEIYSTIKYCVEAVFKQKEQFGILSSEKFHSWIEYPVKFKNHSLTEILPVEINNIGINLHKIASRPRMVHVFSDGCGREGIENYMIPENFVDGIFEHALRFAKIYSSMNILRNFALSRSVTFFVEEAALAINKAYVPGKNIFKIIDKSESEILYHVERLCESRALILDEKTQKSKYRYVLIFSYCEIGLGNKEKREKGQELFCSSLRLAYKENEKRGIHTKIHGVFAEHVNWTIVTYDGNKNVEQEEDKFNYMHSFSFDVHCLGKKKETWKQEQLHFLQSLYALLEKAYKSAD